MGELEDIYTKEWVEGDFKDLEGEFRLAANAIYRQFRPGFVWDVGCGPGFMLAQLYDLDVDIKGFDGSQACLDYARERLNLGCCEHLSRADIRSLTELCGYGCATPWLVLCTEVAEHLDAAHADHLVALLCSAMAPIIFTAASPGQGGHHHVNEQPPEYWREKFMARGCVYDAAATAELKDRWWGLKRLSHMVRNVMVFR